MHFAAESHVDRSIAGAADFVTTNVLGTQTLLDAALRHGLGRFVHVSTDEVYGSIEAGSWTEDAAAGAELAVLGVQGRLATCSRGPTTAPTASTCVVTRCSNNYGPYQFPEKVIPLFVTNLLDGGTVPLYGDGGNVRDWLHVDDHCRGIHLVLDRRPGRRGLQHRRRHRADQQGAHRAAARRPCGAGWDRVEQVRRPARATTGATPSTGPRSTTSSATRRRSASTTGSPRPSSGTRPPRLVGAAQEEVTAPPPGGTVGVSLRALLSPAD